MMGDKAGREAAGRTAVDEEEATGSMEVWVKVGEPSVGTTGFLIVDGAGKDWLSTRQCGCGARGYLQ